MGWRERGRRLRQALQNQKGRRVALWATTFLLTVVVTVLWDKRNELPFFQNEPPSQYAAQHEEPTWAERKAFAWMRRAKRRKPSGKVAVFLSVGSMPRGALSNPCLGREFTSHVIRALNHLHAKVIVIDKFFTPDGCDIEEKDDLLRKAIRESAAPVVVGQETHAVQSEKGNGSLRTEANLFDPHPGDPLPKKGHPTLGLTKINSQVVKVPLQWPLQGQQCAQDGLALAAARLDDPRVNDHERLAEFLEQGEHPVGKYQTDIHAEPLEKLFCADPEERERIRLEMKWDPTCQSAPLGTVKEVVVIGAPSQQDEWNFLGEMESGAQLQARYVDAILEETYLGEFPFWLVFICWLFLSAFLQIAYMILPDDEVSTKTASNIAHGPRLGSWPKNRAVGAVLVSAVVGVVLIALAYLLYKCNYFPPVQYMAETAALLVFAPLLELGVNLWKKTKKAYDESDG